MAINTQSELIDHLRFMAGESSNSLTETDAVRLLNFAIDHYSYLAITKDGLWQVDDTEDSEISRATGTLAANKAVMALTDQFLTLSYVEIEDPTPGDKWRLKTADRRFDGDTTVKSTNTGRPTTYDFYGGQLYFNKYADQAYTVRAFYSRPFNHLAVGSSSQQVGIPSIHTEYLVMYALHRAGLRSGDESREQVRRELQFMERDIMDFYGRRDEDREQKIIGKMDIRR